MWIGRITGTLITPNRAGGFLAQMLMLMIATLLLKIPRLHRIGIGIMTVVTIHALVATESRGAWSAAVIGLAVIGIIGVWKRWIGLRALILALLVLSMVGALVAGQIITRLTEDDRGAAEARGPLAEIANNMIWRNPITGVGINNFGIVLYDYIEAEQLGAWLHLVHNGWLLIWSETGTIGFALYAAFRLMLLWQAFRLIRKGDRLIGIVALGLFASMIGGGIHMTVEIYSSRNLIQIIWIDAALVSAMMGIHKHEEKQRALNPALITKPTKGIRR
jgi:O-antigen ligase